MAKTNTADKPAEQKNTNSNWDRLVDYTAPAVDFGAKAVGATFFVATSYGYVQGWLKTHQAHQDLSIAGGILVVAVALYLLTRKR